MSDLDSMREEIDALDKTLLELLKKRNDVAKKVLAYKLEHQLPVFMAEREEQKTERLRRDAHEMGVDPEMVEDLLRIIMASSRATQSEHEFPMATDEPRHVLLLGGDGGMGKLYRRFLERSGHQVSSIDKGNWYELEQLAPTIDLAIVTVPIHVTLDVIERVSAKLPDHVVLADFTSNKGAPIQAMMQAHKGPVLGLHPMHGPDVPNLSKQLMVICPARDGEKGAWFGEQCKLWGMRVVEADPDAHDHAMDLVQGLRHFVALLHGSFMKDQELKPQQMLDYSSPMYRAELMMTGRIFAQSAELYADIVFSSPERRALLTQFFKHHERLAAMVESNNRAGFIKEFEAVTDFFGSFATQALFESGYLINRLSDRFA